MPFSKTSATDRDALGGQQLLQLAEEMAGVGWWRLMPGGEVHWSPQVYAIHGVTPDSFDPSLDDAVEFYHPDDRAAVARYCRRALTLGEDFAFQLRLYRADGELRHVLCKAVCEGAESRSVVGVFQDITEHVNAMSTLAEAEARYRLLTENAHDLVTRVDRDGRFTYVSPSVHAMTGYAPDEIIGRIARDFIYPEDAARASKAFVAVLTGEGGDTFEYRVVCKNGDLIWVEARPRAVRDAAGNAIAATDVIRDVTARRKAETALAESEARYRLIADNAQDIIALFKPDGEITFVTPGCTRVLGFAPEALIGRKVLDMTHPEDAPNVIDYFEKLIAMGPGGALGPFQYRARARDGRWVWLEGQPRVFFRPDGHAAIMQDVVRDITQRKALEQDLQQARATAEHAAAVKSQFLSNMTHELRTPLTSVLGFAKLISAEPNLSPSGRRALANMDVSGKALLGLIDDILEFSRIESHQVQIVAESVASAPFFAETAAMMEPQARAKALKLSVHIDRSVPEFLAVDPKRLRQALLNLLANAVKFTDSGDVMLTIDYDAPRGVLRCGVRDCGPGIAKGRQRQIFDRFSQLDQSSRRSFGGAGLGLAIVKGLVEAMGGVIGVESDIGEGALFWLEIPVVAGAAPSVCGEHFVSLDQLVGARVLVVDDQELNRELLAHFLSLAGASCVGAASCAEAVSVLEGHAFDAALVDLHMPGIDGEATAHQLRSLWPNLPLLVFTADDRAARRHVAAGLFVSAVRKPIDTARFYVELAGAIGATRTERQPANE